VELVHEGECAGSEDLVGMRDVNAGDAGGHPATIPARRDSRAVCETTAWSCATS
jgi:hypothetical protein